MSRKVFGPPKGGWPTDVVVPSERLARVVARLKGSPQRLKPQWQDMPMLPRFALEMKKLMALEMSKQGDLSRKQLLAVLDE